MSVIKSRSKETVPWMEPEERTTVVPSTFSGFLSTETTEKSLVTPGSMTTFLSGFFLLMRVIL